MTKPSDRKPSRPATQPLEGLNHTVLAGMDQTIQTGSPADAAGNRQLVLEVLTGGRRGLIKRCNKDKFRLGRRSHNDLSFDGKEDRAVSGNHLLLERRADGWWAQDLKSTNGTLLNGKPLTTPTALVSEDVLELGRRPEMGTGGTVKLQLRFEAASESDREDDTQDEPTKTRTADLTATVDGQDAKGSGTGTALPLKEEKKAPDQTPLTTQTIVNPGNKPAKTKEPAKPAPSARPAGDVLAELQDKTLNLGKVSYRLEELLAGLCRAALKDDSIDIAKLSGGPDLLKGMKARAAQIEECKKVKSDLAGHAAHAKTLLTPLESDAKAKKTEQTKAKDAETKARTRAETADAALAKEGSDTRAALKPLLTEIAGGLEAEDPKDKSPWSKWLKNLEQSSAELKKRQPALDKATEEAAAAAKALASAEEAAKKITLEHAVSQDKLENQTAAMAARLTKLEADRDRLTAAVEPAEDEEQEAMADFAAKNLEGAGSKLKDLTGHAKALKLTQQRKELEKELAGLSKQLGA